MSRRTNRKARRRRRWAREDEPWPDADLVTAVRGLGLPTPELGRVRKIGQGLSCDAFAAEVAPGVEGWPRTLAALVPRQGTLVRRT